MDATGSMLTMGFGPPAGPGRHATAVAAPSAEPPARSRLSLPATSGGRLWPLSFEQEGHYRLATLQHGAAFAASNCIHAVLRLRGPVEPDALQGAIDDVVARHSALRTRLARDRYGRAVQEELPALHCPLALRQTSAGALDDAIASLCSPAIPFFEPPLLRVELVRLAAHDALLGIAVHHLAAGAADMGALIRELGAALARRRRGEPPGPAPMSYGEYAAWQRATLGARQAVEIDAARAELAGGTPAPLRHDGPPLAPVPPGVAVHRKSLLSAEEHRALGRLAFRHRASLLVLLLAVVETALRFRSESDDRLVMTTFDRREHPDARRMVGNFLSGSLVRLSMPRAAPLAATLPAMAAAVLAARQRSHLPLERLAWMLPSVVAGYLGTGPPVAALVQLVEADEAVHEFGGIPAQVLARGANLPTEPGLSLQLQRRRDGEIGWRAGYDPRLFRAASIERLATCVAGMARRVVSYDAAESPGELLERVGGW